jgi:hypothetical protein
VKIAPDVAPLLLALNNTATYGGLACSSMVGGLVLLFIDRHYLSLVGAGMILVALLLAEVTYASIARRRRTAGNYAPASPIGSTATAAGTAAATASSHRSKRWLKPNASVGFTISK